MATANGPGRKRRSTIPGDVDAWAYVGFPEANTTPVPDEFFDLIAPKLTEAELRVSLYIIRRTRGFKKAEDAISFSQMVKGITTRDGRVLDRGTGLAKSAVARAINGLLGKGILVKRSTRTALGDSDTNVYSLHFRSGVVVLEKDNPSPSEEPPVVLEKDTQETVEQDTVFSNSSDPPASKSQALTLSKFRKASSHGREEGRVVSEETGRLPAPVKKPATTGPSATSDAVADRGLAHIREVLANVSIAPRPAASGDRSPARARGSKQLAGQPLSPQTSAPAVSESEAAGIRAYLGDYAPELGDRAPFKSSMTRVLNTYLASGMTVAAFTARMDSARRRTKATPKLRNKFSYFLALLEEEVGLREPPPEHAQAARGTAATTPLSQATPPVSAERKSLAGQYADRVRH